MVSTLIQPDGSSAHVSVLLREAVDALAIVPGGIYIDATFGRGGHSRAILAALGDHGRLYAIDRDLQAIEEAKKLGTDPRFHITHSPFSQLHDVARTLEIEGQADGILLDLGVSSPQLDEAERGFSFMRDGPLDMRMDVSSGLTAAQWLAKADVEDISWVLKTFGEERSGWRIAQRIVEVREQQPLIRTSELANLVETLLPARRRDKKHAATQTFQAIRIYINSELDEIKQALEAALKVLKPGGRLVVISFHSLEDRIVKQFIKKHSKGAPVPKGLPLTDAQLAASLHQGLTLKTIGKAIKPGKTEVAENIRSRSSVLRIAERLNG